MSDHRAAFPPVPGPAGGNGTIPIIAAPTLALGAQLTPTIGSVNAYARTADVTEMSRWNRR